MYFISLCDDGKVEINGLKVRQNGRKEHCDVTNFPPPRVVWDGYAFLDTEDTFVIANMETNAKSSTTFLLGRVDTSTVFCLPRGGPPQDFHFAENSS